MLFHSTTFLFGFLPTVLLLFSLVPKQHRLLCMILVSFVFYSWSWLPLLGLLSLSALVNYAVGACMLHSSTPHEKKFWLIIGAFFNVFILIVMKYAGMITWTINALAEAPLVPLIRVTLPLGISFITFEQISYLIDLHSGKEGKHRFLEYGCFMSFFPHLIAGPIVRFGEVRTQLADLRVSWGSIAEGLHRFSVGIAKKVLLADLCASIADPIFAMTDRPLVLAWIGLAAYSLQIYLDFSGYTDMAIGLGLMFGVKLPENFDAPYLARTVTEFWRRWHMTLSRWVRDYIYIPLGGNRGDALRTARNLFLAMLIIGTWHGANWTFVLWGGYFGIILVAERLMLKETWMMPRSMQHTITLFLVAMGWVLFRNQSPTEALQYYQDLFLFGDSVARLEVPWWSVIGIVIAGSCTALDHVLRENLQQRKGANYVSFFLLLLSLGVLLGGAPSSFIYFQF